MFQPSEAGTAEGAEATPGTGAGEGADSPDCEEQQQANVLEGQEGQVCDFSIARTSLKANCLNSSFFHFIFAVFRAAEFVTSPGQLDHQGRRGLGSGNSGLPRPRRQQGTIAARLAFFLWPGQQPGGALGGGGSVGDNIVPILRREGGRGPGTKTPTWVMRGIPLKNEAFCRCLRPIWKRWETETVAAAEEEEVSYALRWHSWKSK